MDHNTITLDGLSHAQWLEERRKGIGGSDAGAIAGVNPWRSPMAVYLDKLGLASEVEDNESMELGRELEDFIAAKFTKKTGLEVIPCSRMLQHKDYPWMLGNIDRIILSNVKAPGVLEIKTGSEFTKKDWFGGAVPESYYLQIQHYMAFGFTWGYFAVLLGGNKFFYLEVKPDYEVMEKLILLEKDFWENNVLKQIPPAMTGQDDEKDLLNFLYPTAKPDTHIDLTGNQKAHEFLEMYLSAKEQRERAEQEEKAAQNELKMMVGNYHKGFIGNATINYYNVKGRESVDTNKLRNERPEIYREYAKQGDPYRVMKIYKK